MEASDEHRSRRGPAKADQIRRSTVTGRRRSGALRSLVAVLGSGLLAGLTAPAAFAAPLPQAARDTGPSVRVGVESMSPRDLTGDDAHGQLTFSGHLTNAGSAPLRDLRIRVQRGQLISTRSELHLTAEGDLTLPVVRSCDWQTPAVAGGLAPGASIPFHYRCDLDTLRMTLIGVYPLTLRVEAGTVSQGFVPVGEVRTYLPSFPQGVTARTQVSWLWPLVDQPHRLATSDRFVDDDLGRSVSDGGRLDRMLSLAEHAPEKVQLTLVVDPALVDELDQMERGYQVRSGDRWVPGRSGPAATTWLDRLRHLAERFPVAALPYGDPDVVALSRAGMSDLARITPADRALVADRLGVTPITTLAWPPDGMVTPEALTSLVEQGTQAVVLDSAALPGRPAFGPTPGSVTRLHTPNRTQAVALVPDDDVSAAVRGSRSYPEGPRLAEQRYLTELAMITAEAPSNGRELVVAPPRRWDPDPRSASAMIADTTAMPWLASGSAAELAHHQPDVDRGPLVYPASARGAELPRTLISAIAQISSEVDDFRSAPVSRQSADQVLAPFDKVERLAGSSAWRTGRGGTGYVAEIAAEVARLRSGVHIVKPSGSGVYVLASSNSPLILTVANDLPEAVRFRVRITGRGTSGFTVGDIGEQTIQARTRRTIQIPARVERSGLFVVDALVTTPAGRPLGVDGAPVRLKVRSTAYGLIGLVITSLALALLLLLVFRRLAIRIRRGRGGRGDSAGGAGAGGAAGGQDSAPAGSGSPTSRDADRETDLDPSLGTARGTASDTGRGIDRSAGGSGPGSDPIGEATLDTTLGAHPARTAAAERSIV